MHMCPLPRVYPCSGTTLLACPLQVQREIRRTIAQLYALFEIFDTSPIPDGQINFEELGMATPTPLNP